MSTEFTIPCVCCKLCRYFWFGPTRIDADNAPETLTATLTFPWQRRFFSGKPYTVTTINNYNTITEETDVTVSHSPRWDYMETTYGITPPAVDCEIVYYYEDSVLVSVTSNTCGGTTIEGGVHVDSVLGFTCDERVTECPEDTVLSIDLTRVEYDHTDAELKRCCIWKGEVTHTFEIPWRGRRLDMSTFTSAPPFEVSVDYPSGITESSGTYNLVVKFTVFFSPCTGVVHRGKVVEWEGFGVDTNDMVQIFPLPNPTSLDEGSQVALVTAEIDHDLSDYDFDLTLLENLMPSDPKLSDGVSEDWGPGSLSSEFLGMEGFAFCLPMSPSPLIVNKQTIDSVLIDYIEYSGGSFTYDWVDPGYQGGIGVFIPYFGQILGAAIFLDGEEYSPTGKNTCGESVAQFQLQVAPSMIMMSGSRSAAAPPAHRSPCQHLGAAVSFCTSCGKVNRELRNLHRCEHPEHGDTLGRNQDGLVRRGQDCQTCPHYQASEEAPGSPGP